MGMFYIKKKVDILVLTITILTDGNLNFQTYHNPRNLYLYLPSHSAHPPGTLQGIIFITL